MLYAVMTAKRRSTVSTASGLAANTAASAPPPPPPVTSTARSSYQLVAARTRASSASCRRRSITPPWSVTRLRPRWRSPLVRVAAAGGGADTEGAEGGQYSCSGERRLHSITAGVPDGASSPKLRPSEDCGEAGAGDAHCVERIPGRGGGCSCNAGTRRWSSPGPGSCGCASSLCGRFQMSCASAAPMPACPCVTAAAAVDGPLVQRSALLVVSQIVPSSLGRPVSNCGGGGES
ncbi:hypothetical protein Vafri_1209 [Volvox africanus]|nr:hypothetical protein Vafri_1209 [Volvox africanus]